MALAACVAGAGLLTACSSSSSSSQTTTAPSGKVLLVGTYKGHAGKYTSIQAAVNAAKPGDWVLVAPGDYHETADSTSLAADPAHGDSAGVLITKANLHLRGMDRSTVVVDGTKAGSPQCSANPADQTYGPIDPTGKAYGRNGIVVWKADNVSIDNLTTCNFLGGSGDSGNGVWWNGGADSAKIGLHGYTGSYLTATSTYYGGNDTAATYGIFSQDASGPASWNQIYGSNFNDSGTYVGACQQVCGITINHAWMEYNALGYSGTNSGGAIVIENSQFDNNRDGFDTNTQIAGDPPAPQNGACPNNGISPITHTHSCWVLMHNSFHDNNNPNAPGSGYAGNAPVGTGMTLSGGRNDTVMDNTFANNGAWGFLMVPFPDSSTPEYNQSCSGTGGVQNGAFGCVYDPMNNALLHNTFSHNGYFGNPSNGDYGQITLNAGQPSNCYVGNTAPNGSTPADLEKTQPTCGVTTKSSNTGGPLLAQVLCDFGSTPCGPDMVYPKSTGVVMHPLPKGLPTMADPCSGVPDNAWCTGGKTI
ncbi:MAG TPA: hypothetical protein VND44_04190 [Acidimicrobiales bacterium]|nr:hypothetical protein [Acidimicrobiales bacterium]